MLVQRRPHVITATDVLPHFFEAADKFIVCILLSCIIPLEKLRLNPADNILLVFGSEGEGVSRAISKAADHKIVIPP